MLVQKNLFILLLSLLAIQTVAQNKAAISGRLVDSTNHKITINYATVSVYKVSDSTLIAFKLSDESGNFKISNIDTGKSYKVVITAWQFKTFRREFTVTGSNKPFDFGEIILTPQKNLIDEVVIRREVPPIMVRQDTIEFNAESFKTLPTAVVEDLLKKLPGIVIESSGEIRVNGKIVSRILVDGRQFFGGDKQIATKNLPANIIEKVQVSNDKDILRNNPDLFDANTPQVINLKLKKGVKQGAFGKVYAGGGLKEFFEAGAILNFFRDTTQLSVITYANNINKPGFSLNEVNRIGGFQRGGYTNVTSNGDSGFSLDNISFGGSGGINKSGGAGLNFNTLSKKGLVLNGRYFFGHNDAVTSQLINDNQTLGVDRLITQSDFNLKSITNSHSLSANLEWSPNPTFILTFNPNATFNPVNSANIQNKYSTDVSGQPINTSQSTLNNEGNNNQYGFTANMNKAFKKRGRILGAGLSFNSTSKIEDNVNHSSSYFNVTNSGAIIDQLRNTRIKNIGSTLSINYSEPLKKSLSLSLRTEGTIIENENALITFFRDPTNQNYEVIVPSLSETVTQSGIKSTTSAKLKWAISKTLSIQPGVTFNTINLKNSFANYIELKQNYLFLAPSLVLRNKALLLSYIPSFTAPDVAYIQPIVNNTDPLFQQLGNPDLLPTRNHNVLLTLSRYIVKKNLNYQINFNGTVKSDAVIISRSISPSGIQTNIPINTGGTFQTSLSGLVSKNYKDAQTQFTISVAPSIYYNRNVVVVNSIKSNTYSVGLSPRIAARININDAFELNQTYNYSYNRSTYQDAYFTDLSYTSQTSETELIIRYPKKLAFETLFRIQHNNQNIPGYANNIKIWNAGLTYAFLKNDRAQLKLSVNDILANNVRRNIFLNENSVRDIQTNNLGRYGLLTLNYNIQNFGGKIGGKQRFFGF